MTNSTLKKEKSKLFQYRIMKFNLAFLAEGFKNIVRENLCRSRKSENTKVDKLSFSSGTHETETLSHTRTHTTSNHKSGHNNTDDTQHQITPQHIIN
jgi:hypothetical protein